MNKKFLFSFLFLFCSATLFSQYTYYRNDYIAFTKNNRLLKNPTVGGFNAPQFNQIDLNFDGYPDLLVFDRSGNKISTFLNDGIKDSISFTYAPEYIRFFPTAQNFILSRDYNCDGKMDLFVNRDGIVVYQNISNNGNLKFKEITKLKSNYRPRDLTIRPFGADLIGIEDIDGDGDLDILEPYYLGRQMIAYHKNLSVENNNSCGLEFKLMSKCWGEFTESNLNSTIFLDSCRFPDFPDAELSGNSKNDPFTHHRHEKHGNAGIAIHDLDDNGSMDILLGDDGSSRLVALFNEDSIAPRKNSYIFRYDTLYPSYDKSVDLRLFPTAFFIDVNNDSIEDMIVASNTIDVLSLAYAKENIHLYLGTGNKNRPFTYHTNTFLDDEMVDVGRGSFPATFDYNKDGLQDFVLGNEGNLDSNSTNLIGKLALFKNTGTNLKPKFNMVDENYLTIDSLNLYGNNTPTSRLVPAFYDLNGDGREDLILGDDNGYLHYFVDTATNNQAASFQLKEATMQGVYVYDNASPAIIDINNNGLGDLILASQSPYMQLNLNLGDSTNPVFNLSVASIVWQSGNTLRYQLIGKPNLNLLKVGQKVDVNNSVNPDNDVIQEIAAIDNNQKYLDLIHPFTNNSNNDELSSTAVIDYGIKDWGKIDMGTNTHPSPKIYKDQNDFFLILGSYNGKFYLYDSISNNLKGKFRQRSDDYLPANFGRHTIAAPYDLNGDGKEDLIVGNQAGGVNILYARYGLGIDDVFAQKKSKHRAFDIYPNPTQKSFTIKFNQQTPQSRLQIYTINGKLMYENELNRQEVRVDENLKKGLYFIKISNPLFSETKKLIVH